MILMTYSTYNIELQMTQECYEHWMNLLKQTTKAYNACAAYAVAKKVPLNIKDFHNECYSLIRDNFKAIPAQGAIKIYKDVLSALRSIRSNKHTDAATPCKRHMSMHLDKRMYARLSVNGIALPTAVKNQRETCTFVMYDKAREMFAKHTFADPSIFERDRKLYLSVPFEMPGIPVSGENAVGVDLGVRRFFVTSDGKAFRDKKYLVERRKVRYLKRKLRKKGTHSANRLLKKLRRREHNLSKDMQHRAANSLIKSTSASYIIMEDLSKIKQKTSKTKAGVKRKNHNRMLSQVAFASFKDILTHKAQLAGKQVETVSPTWTSQTDCRTNTRDGERRGCRYYGLDGTVMDADWNAAVNIAKRSKHPVSYDTPIDGRLTFLTGRVQSMIQRRQGLSPTASQRL